MPFDYSYSAKYLCNGALIVSLLFTICALYAYSINSQRADDDPEKRNYRLGAIFFVFFTWPLLVLAFISLFILRALLYGLVILLFTISLIIIPRESSEPIWLEKMIARIGNALLEANTFLIKLFLRPWADAPETI